MHPSGSCPHLIRSHGHLVNIGSLSGKSASRYVGAYSATKFALAAYTQQLRLELQPQGVHVLLVSPGPIAREDQTPASCGQAGRIARQRGQAGRWGANFTGQPEKLSQAILKACRRRQPELVYPPLGAAIHRRHPDLPAIGRLGSAEDDLTPRADSLSVAQGFRPISAYRLRNSGPP